MINNELENCWKINLKNKFSSGENFLIIFCSILELNFNLDLNFYIILMFITGYLKNIFHNKKVSYWGPITSFNVFKNLFFTFKDNDPDSPTYNPDEPHGSGFDKTFTLGRQKTRKSADKDLKKQRSLSISARHAVSSLDVSTNNTVSSRVSISEFKTNFLPKNKPKLKPADDIISITCNSKEPKVELYDDYLDNEYATSDESEYNFPDIQISEIVEKAEKKSPAKSFKKPSSVKHEDPFLKDLTARLQLKQRQKKTEEVAIGPNKENSKSPKHNSSSKESPITTPIHQFSLFKSNKEDKTLPQDSTSTGPTTPKRFNLQSFNLNKSDSSGSKKSSPTHSSSATETFTRNFNKLNFNYSSLSNKSSSKEKSTKDLTKKESPTKKLFSKIDTKESKADVKVDPKQSDTIHGRKFLELPLKRRSVSPKEPPVRKVTQQISPENKVPLRNLKTPMFTMMKTPEQEDKTNSIKPVAITKRNFFTPSKKDLATPLVTDPPKVKIPASPSKPITPTINKDKLGSPVTKVNEKKADSEEVILNTLTILDP